jgi:Outer membrane efflux protein
LGGLAGLRTCELIRSVSDDPVLCWEENLIFVRHEVAKQTRARDRRRYIPLEPAAGKILGPLAGTGPIMTISVGYLHKLRRKLAGLMKIKLPENCFRIPSHGFSSPNCFGRLGNQRLACDLRIVAEERIPKEAAWEDPKLNFRSLLGRFVQIPANGFTDQTVSIEQTIPLSGKNRSRERAAAAEAVADLEQKRSDDEAALKVLMNGDAFGSLERPALQEVHVVNLDARELRSQILLNNPEVLRANAQLAAAQSRYQLAKREWVPDPTVSIQADHYNAGSQFASEVSGGVSISLPWFNEKKYSANEREALDQVTAAQDTLDGVKNEALGRLKDQLQKIQTLHHHATVRTSRLPNKSSSSSWKTVITGRPVTSTN